MKTFAVQHWPWAVSNRGIGTGVLATGRHIAFVSTGATDSQEATSTLTDFFGQEDNRISYQNALSHDQGLFGEFEPRCFFPLVDWPPGLKNRCWRQPCPPKNPVSENPKSL
jgi:hypothetical protein